MPDRMRRGYHPDDLTNTPPIPKAWLAELKTGMSQVIPFISRLAVSERAARKGKCFRIAIDGHLGVDWKQLISALENALRKRGLQPKSIDIASCLRSTAALEKMVRPCLPDDPTFGRIYPETLADFFDKRKVSSLQKTLISYADGRQRSAAADVVIIHGSGAAGSGLRACYDAVFYIDLAREEILKRLKRGLAAPLGTAPAPAKAKASPGDALPAYFSTRRFYYVDYPVLDKHRRQLLPTLDYYIDGNALNVPKLLPGEVFRQLLDLLVSGPIKPKPYYDPSPWGGQWLKRVRRLPKQMVNCAWSYDLIEPETSFRVALGKTRMEIPFPVLTCWKPLEILGSKGRRKKFQGEFPIRINYDDSYEGGDMALQVHPGDAYIQKHFGEPYRQDESYYVVDTAPGSKVYLGLKEEADVRKFRRAVLRAEKEGIPFDHNQYVNSLASAPGDLFLIPAGTLHGSGRNETVLEISATTYRYTFHFYDFLRPGLDGKLRPIHSKHAFAVLRTERRTRWVESNLKQPPRVVREGKGWAEVLLGARADMFYKVHRLEFEREIKDDTAGEFHLLVPVVGEGIRIRPHRHPASATELPFSCLVVIPAAMGAYTLQGLGDPPCKVVKVLMK